ncbi:hypothetical protein B0H19DRAFT_1214550 [Mycena capillaripes]|nr:hypothetical protein B0H19DRAFT_1214550 [Mycena capillaripes]
MFGAVACHSGFLRHGCKDVPSFDHLRRVQKEIRSDSGIPSIPCKSPLGNVFFMNNPRAIIAQAKDGIIRKIWHAQKWRKNLDLSTLSPMYDAGSSHYYVNELAHLKSGELIIPVRWVRFRGKVYADAFSVTLNEQVPGHPERMPNPKRAIAKGRPLYHSFVDYFGDGVSGNCSKSWNKHWNAYMTPCNLPRRLLQQEFHVHFVSTSPNASISEQYREFKHAVDHLIDQHIQNPWKFGMNLAIQHSEVSGHIGSKGNHFCRKCEPEHLAQRKKIMAELENQVKLACAGVAKPITDSQTQTGVKDMYTQYWINHLLSRFKDMKTDDSARSNQDIQAELVQWTVDNRDTLYSAFLATDDFFSGFDPTKDTPVEILHTILLGVVKYIWHISHTPWSPEKKKIYSLRLQSTAVDGLSIHAIRTNYIMQYAGSLIGWQFKTIAQTSVFHVYGLVTEHQFMAWKAAGELAALLWVPEIRDINEYRRDLKFAVANVLDVFSLIDPSKIITKIKLHLLAHIDDDAVEFGPLVFGPLVGVATEIFESFNAIFRYCSILSNHLAPSRGLETPLTGGWWFCRAAEEWQRAGSGVRHFMSQHPVLQRLLGWSEAKLLKHGTLSPVQISRGQKHRTVYSLRSTTAANAVNYGTYESESTWYRGSAVVGESLDECFIRSWIFAQSASDANSMISGRISEILINVAGVAVVVLEVFQVLSVRDKIYGMPVLVRRDGETIFSIISAKNVKFNVNVQHDCYRAKCGANGERLRLQERVESDQIENFIVHESLDRFIINSYAFHNAHLLRATLPRHKRKARVQLAADGAHDASTKAKRRRKEPAQDLPAEQLLEDSGLAAAAYDDIEEDEDGGESETEDSDMYISSDDYSDSFLVTLVSNFG